jgi:anti-anti-sigma factor
MPQPIGKTAPRISSGSNLVRTSSLGSCLTIHVEGRFDFNCHQQFRRAYEGAAAPVTEYVVDLRGTEYIDSAALGMLLVLRESAASASVRITNSRPAVRKILQIANFNTLFAID